MTTGRRRFRKSIDKIDFRKENIPNEFPGILGITLGGSKKVEVPNRDGYVYVRLRDDLSELIQAYNDEVSPVYGLPVLVIRDKVDRTRYKIKSRDLGRYQAWGTSSYLPKHGATHSFDPSSPGGDPVWVWGRQYMPLGAVPSGTSGGPNVIIQPSTYWQNGWKYAGGTGTADIVGYKPTGSNARMVLTYLDSAGNPRLEPGAVYFDAGYTGTSQIVPYIPNLPETSGIPIAGIRLVSGTSSLGWGNIYDLRPHIVGDGFIPTGTYGHVIAKDDAALDHRPTLNFLGSGFTVYNDADSTNVSGSASGHSILEDATPLTQRPDLSFGGGLIAYDDSSNARTIVSGTVQTFPQRSVIFAGTNQYLTSYDYFKFYSNHPTLIMGGNGDTYQDDLGGATVWQDYILTLINNGLNNPLSIFGYDTSQPALISRFHAGNTETSPTLVASGDTISEDRIFGFGSGTYGFGGFGFSKFIQVGNLKWLARENFSNTFGTKLEIELTATGTQTRRDAFVLHDNEAYFYGNVSIPTGTSASVAYPAFYLGHPDTSNIYPDGTWRINRENDNLVFQRKESGSWVTKQTMTP